MYKIEAFLRPAALEKVQEALAGLGIMGLSVKVRTGETGDSAL